MFFPGKCLRWTQVFEVELLLDFTGNFTDTTLSALVPPTFSPPLKFYADKTEGFPLPELGGCPVCRSLSGTRVPPSIFHLWFYSLFLIALSLRRGQMLTPA